MPQNREEGAQFHLKADLLIIKGWGRLGCPLPTPKLSLASWPPLRFVSLPESSPGSNLETWLSSRSSPSQQLLELTYHCNLCLEVIKEVFFYWIIVFLLLWKDVGSHGNCPWLVRSPSILIWRLGKRKYPTNISWHYTINIHVDVLPQWILWLWRRPRLLKLQTP